jgi:hypothetical protein
MFSRNVDISTTKKQLPRTVELKHVSVLVALTRAVTGDTALRLAHFFGTSVGMTCFRKDETGPVGETKSGTAFVRCRVRSSGGQFR